MTADANARLHRLPAVDRVLAEKPLAAWSGSPLATGAVREELASAREEVRSGGAVPTPGELAARAAARLDRRFAPRLRRVINGTGIIIHTNLGRAPLGEEAIAAMAEAARGYCTLEFDLPRGRRGSRHTLVQPLLTALTGAEDALVANNNAAALLLALAAFSKRKEVIVSRGQLVEIGGSFRIPDICRASGARLREVGTTNRTRLSDYEEAVGARSGVLLRVHPSNYRIIGFTGEVSLVQLVELGRTRSLPVVDDLGSGALLDISRRAALPAEPLVAESVAAGATVVTFSGDKLLGGPQAGIAVGQHDAIERMRRNPLMRAVRPDKVTLAALDATLRAYLTPREVGGKLPVWRMLMAPVEELRRWGEPVLEAVKAAAAERGLAAGLAPSSARSGGGSLPEEELQSLALCFTGGGRRLNALQKRLRFGDPPVIGYLREGALWLDLRTMFIEPVDRVSEVLLHALNKEGGS